MKKRPCLLDSDWKNYNENTSDFLKKSFPVKKKRTSKDFECNSIFRDNSNLQRNDSFHIDESGSWKSSFEEDAQISSNDYEKSPVIGCKQVKSDGFCIKSTPAGSPILSQRNKASMSVKNHLKKLSLFPLSPITPGTHLNFSFQNASHFSIHVHDESNNDDWSHDQTPLALPLPDSDSEIVEDYEPSIPTSTLLSDDIETFATQNNDKAESPSISTLEDPSSQLTENKSCPVKAKGSEWLEDVMERFDRTCQSSFKLSAMQTTVCYDSTKKKKFVRNGLAERLQNVLKKEQTEKIIFQHQLKELQRQDMQPQTHMKMKVVSHHKEGLLHILECKVLSSSNSLNKEKFYTVMLKDENVVADGLDLMSVFTVYPPWKEMRLKGHNFPVLICVYHLIVDPDSTLSASASQSQLDSQDETCLVAAMDNCWTRDCENLLEALEKQNHEQGVCLAATVQRQYQQTTTGSFRWTWLCEDAFGVFFELLLETSLSDDVNWSRLIAQGEGQRLYFQKLFLIGRTSRSQSPALFALIDSVWDPEGFGLRQVHNSQSQNSSDCGSQPLVLPPSFCYRFHARKWQSSCHCHSTRVQDDVISLCSELNRPRIDGSSSADVLYRDCIPLLCADASAFVRECGSPKRCSILGSVFHFHLLEHPPRDAERSTSSNESINIVFIVDHSSSSSQHIIPITFAHHHGASNLALGDKIFIKDILLLPDFGFRTDPYSYVRVLDEKTCDENSERMLPPHVLSKKQVLSHCVKFDLPTQPQLNDSSAPGQFASATGVVCDLCVLHSSNDQASLNEKSLTTESLENIFKKSNVSSRRKYLFEILITVSLNIKVKLKCFLETILNLLPRDFTTLPKGKSSLNGVKINSVNCYIYAKCVKSHLTLFYAEEIFNQ